MGIATLKLGGLVAIAMLLLLGSNMAVADENSASPSQPLSFSVGSLSAPAGGVVDLGNQQYVVRGGAVVLPLTLILGQPLDSATLHFSLTAEVRALRVSGNVRFDLKGTTAGQPVSVTGEYRIDDSLTSTPTNVIQFINPPSGNCGGEETAARCSELPLSFIGSSKVHVTVGGTSSQVIKEIMIMENPYLNPFGAPIVIASADGTATTPPSVLIVTTYDVGTIKWTGAQVVGAITSGTLGTGSSSTPVTGMLTLISTQNEDLVNGAARESGTIAFTSMTPSSLDLSGTFTGTSLIPTTGEQDCSAFLGFPTFPDGLGVCTQTGFNSVGQYTAGGNNNVNGNGHGHDGKYKSNDDGNGDQHNNGKVTLSGRYITTWTVPAFAFSTTSTGTFSTTSTGTVAKD